MKQQEPFSTGSFASLRRLHRAQRYSGDLGQIAEAPRRGRWWRAAGIAALLALTATAGWLLAPSNEPPVARRPAPEPPDTIAPPRMETLELPHANRQSPEEQPREQARPAPEPSRQAVLASGHAERRVVLPGMPALTRASLPAAARRPALPPRPVFMNQPTESADQPTTLRTLP